MKKYFKLHKKKAILILLILIIMNGFNSGNSYLNILMTNAVMEKNMKKFALFFSISLLVMIVFIGLTYLKNILVAHSKKEISVDMRKDYLEKYINEYDFENETDGEAISRLTNDVDYCVLNNVTNNYELCNMIIGAVTSLIIAGLIHWSFIIVFPVSSFISFLVMNKMMPIMQSAAENQSKENGEFVSRCKGMFIGFSVLYGYHVLDEFKKKINAASEDLENKKMDYNIKTAFAYAMVMTATIFSQLAYIVDAGVLIVLGITTPGTIVGLMSIAAVFYSNVQQMLQLFGQMKASKPVVEKIIANDTEKVAKVMDNPKKEIKVNNLFYGYDENNPIIKDYNYTFKIGNKYLIKGKSGSGKTSLLKVLSGRKALDKGEVLYDDNNLKKTNAYEITKVSAYMNQNVYIFDASIKENITLGRKVSEKVYRKAIEIADLNEFIESKNEKDEYELKGDKSNISGGQAQRIALARALCSERKVLFLDEPLSACDVKSANKIEKNLLKLKDMTVFMVSHRDVKDIEQLYDDVILI